MRVIIDSSEIQATSEKLKREKRTIALVGGCFDILHLGHITFLEEAKKQADNLWVFLESDKKIKFTKGSGRPIHDEKSRAKILSAIQFVDYVVILPFLTKGEEYDDLVKKLAPDVIVTTEGDKHLPYKQRSANLVGAKLIQVPFIKDFSSSKLIQGSDL
jgi:FAD synthetase